MRENLDKSSRRKINKVIFLFPVIILLIGVIAYYILMPDIYSEDILFIDWLLSDSRNILDRIYYTNNIQLKNNNIIEIQIFWRIWLLSFNASLFFVGKQLHTKSVCMSADAVLINREPYLMIQGMSNKLRQLKYQEKVKEVDALIYSLKCLEEKLSIESDFGYGDKVLIDCENNIAAQLHILINLAQEVESGNFIENIKVMNNTVRKIHALLKERNELKKH